MVVADGSPDRQLTEQGRERKQQLVDAAMVLFAERGYGATRIKDICDQAGVAKGLLYWYFPTKLDLFIELVRTMRLRLRRAQAAAMAPSDDPLERIRLGSMASVRFMVDHATYFSLLDVERADPAIAGALREGSEVYRHDLLALITAAQANGSLPDVDPELLVVGTQGAITSFTMAYRNGQIDRTVDELAEFVGAWIVSGLRLGG